MYGGSFKAFVCYCSYICWLDLDVIIKTWLKLLILLLLYFKNLHFITNNFNLFFYILNRSFIKIFMI